MYKITTASLFIHKTASLFNLLHYILYFIISTTPVGHTLNQWCRKKNQTNGIFERKFRGIETKWVTHLHPYNSGTGFKLRPDLMWESWQLLIGGQWFSCSESWPTVYLHCFPPSPKLPMMIQPIQLVIR